MMVERTAGKECSLAYDSIPSITMQQNPNGISSPNRIFGSAVDQTPERTSPRKSLAYFTELNLDFNTFLYSSAFRSSIPPNLAFQHGRLTFCNMIIGKSLLLRGSGLCRTYFGVSRRF